MISILFYVVGIVLLFVPNAPLNKSKELKRPQSIYLGIITLVAGLLLTFFPLDNQLAIFAPALLSVGLLVAALVLATPKTDPSQSENSFASAGSRLVTIITWSILGVILSGMLFIAFRVFFD